MRCIINFFVFIVDSIFLKLFSFIMIASNHSNQTNMLSQPVIRKRGNK